MEKFPDPRKEDQGGSARANASDPPPSYEESQESFETPSLRDDRTSQSRFMLWRSPTLQKRDTPTASQQATLDFVRPSKPIIFLTPDPRKVLCRCGRKIDTTRPSPGLDMGSVRCPCGYVLGRDGSSRYEPSVVVCPGNHCGRRIGWPQDTSSFHACYCGQRFSRQGIPLYLDTGELDVKGVRCPCGELQNTSERCRVVHKDECHYEYDDFKSLRNVH